MNKTIPVMVHHETGEKAQAAGKKNQEYIKYCIAQAKKYNEKVVLLGDKYNKAWCEEWYNADDFITDKWKKFRKVFENFSTYPDAWAEGIFKRFFLILEYLECNHLENCVIIDSDVLLYLNVSEYEPFRHCKVAAETPLSQDLSMLPEGNGLCWKTCAGFSFFTIEGLREFTDFCIDIYTNHKDLLMKKWNVHRKYGLYGGVGEMALLYLWVQSLPKGEYLNLLQDDANHCVFDNSVGESHGYLKNQYEYIKRLCVKKLHWEDGRPYCYTNDKHEKTWFLNLHFVDITKVFMEGIYKKQTYTAHAKMVTYYLKCRGRLADIKHGNTKWQQRIKIKRDLAD